MKVLMINGSPNERGCTYTALSEIAEILHAEGIETEILQLGKQPLMGCTGCEACRREGAAFKCIYGDGDGVNSAIEKLNSSDGLVIGSPVYFAGINGALKAFLDRMFYAGSRGFGLKLGAGIVSARRAGTTAALDQMNKYFLYAQMPLISSQYWNMVHGNRPEEVRQDLEGLQIMRTLGRNMAWMLKSIEVAKGEDVKAPEKEDRIGTNFIR